MKKYIRIILSIFLFAGIGCADWIDVKPENSVTYTNYFKTEKDAQGLLYGLNWNLRNMPMYFTSRNELIANLFSPEEYTLPLQFGAWTREYWVIDAANLIIENAFRFSLPEETIRPYVLQAYFAKAQAYFELAMAYGEVPIIEDGGNYKKYGKSAVSEVLDEAEKWALKAMEIPKYEELKIGDINLCKQYGSKGAVAALLAKLYAWRAGVEDKKEYWAKAEEYCTEIIENKVGNYRLAEDPEVVCTSVMKGESQEGIWEIYQDTKEGGTFYGDVIESSVIGFPVISTSLPTSFAIYYVTKGTVNRLFDEEDRRRDAYFWGIDADSVYIKYVNGSEIPDVKVEKGDSVLSRFDNKMNDKAFLYKFRYPYYEYMDNSPKPRFVRMNMRIVKCRLADIILLRAECRARQNKANAVDDLNKIRFRAYGDDAHAYPNADDVTKGLDKDILLAIFREREKELFLEGHRYYDARRNGIDYVRRLLPSYQKLTDQEIKDGALYMGLAPEVFENNDLMRQNVYWNSRKQ